MKIVNIRFTARWQVADGNTTLERIDKTEFKLGPGRCGKEVVELRSGIFRGLLEIRQWCSDGSAKTFTYRMEDILGRIEVEEVPT